MDAILIRLLGAGAIIAFALGWLAIHDHNERDIGRAETAAKVQAAFNVGVKAAAAKYAKQVKERDDAIADFKSKQANGDAAFGAAQRKLHDYENQLHTAAAAASACSAGRDPAGTEIVRFGLTDYQRFAETALDVAKRGEDDARELRLCKKFADTVSPLTR